MVHESLFDASLPHRRESDCMSTQPSQHQHVLCEAWPCQLRSSKGSLRFNQKSAPMQTHSEVLLGVLNPSIPLQRNRTSGLQTIFHSSLRRRDTNGGSIILGTDFIRSSVFRCGGMQWLVTLFSSHRLRALYPWPNIHRVQRAPFVCTPCTRR